MKRQRTTTIILLLITGLFFITCSEINTASSDDSRLGGQEDLLEGAWWINHPMGNDGAYFDGTGNGYDMSGDYPDGLYVECDDPLTYTYDGTNFTKTEDPNTVSGMFILNGDGSGGTLTVTQFGITQILAVEKIESNTYTIDGDCLD